MKASTRSARHFAQVALGLAAVALGAAFILFERYPPLRARGATPADGSASDAQALSPRASPEASAARPSSPLATSAPPAPPAEIPPASAAARGIPRPSVRQIAPALSLLRQEIARGPDQAPPSLLLFSIRLGELEAAVAAPAEAARLMGQIEGCVLERAADGERYPEAVQMICLQSAKTLTGRFTQLGPRYERLRGAAPSGAGALLD